MKHIRRPLSFLLTLVMLVTSVGLGLTATAWGDASPQATATITLKANAEGVTNMPSNPTVTVPGTVKMPPTEGQPTPTRDGYTFQGWSYSSDPTANAASALAPGTEITLTQAKDSFTAYAVWKKNPVYTLHFDANGGSGAPADITGYGEVTIPSKVPTRDHYTFRGWALSAAEASPAYHENGPYNLNGNVTLYAVWKQYTLTFNANGGSGAPDSLTGGKVKIPDTKPAKKDSAFQGWATSKTATTPSALYQAGKEVTLSTNLTVYAVWKTSAGYTLTYDANNGTGAPAAQTGSGSITLSSTKPTRDNYIFDGWSMNSSATTASYSAGGSFTLNGDVTLYAVWKQYTVSFNANGGSGAPPAQTGSKFTFTSTKPTRSGYTFVQWNTAQDGSGTNYAGTGTFDLTEDMTLYAQWRSDAEYSMSFDANGGGGAPATIIYTGKTYLPLQTPVRPNYTFLGWATSTSAFPVYQPGEFYWASSKDVKFYAIWHKDGVSNTLTFNATQSGVTNLPATQTSTTGTWTIPTTKPTLSGYKFLGWKGSGGVNTPFFVGGEKVSFSGNATLNAVFVATSETVYTLTFNANNGTGAPPARSFGATVGRVVMPHSIPTRSGYRFLGWSTSSSATSPTYTAHFTYSSITQSMTLYAVWEQVSELTLTFNANKGSGAPAAIKTNGPSSVVLPGKDSLPTRSGYTCMGWSTSSSTQYPAAEGVDFHLPGTNFSLTANTTLYAVWKQNARLTFNANGGTGAPAAISGYGLVTLPNTTPSRNDYSFLGWAYNAEGTGSYVQPGSRIWLDSNTTLYAVWTMTHTVYFHYNGGFDANGSSGPAATFAGDRVLTGQVVPARTGFRLKGWSEDPNATKATYSTYTTIYLFAEERARIDLYAVWEKYGDNICTLKYNLTGGTCDMDLAPQDGAPNTFINLWSWAPSRSGYVFLGWSPNINASYSTYQAGGRYFLTGSTTLFAIWAESGTTYYTVTYDGLGGSPVPDTQKGTGTFTIHWTNPSREGYQFKGWTDVKNSSTAKYSPGGTFTPTKNVTLYAAWEEWYTVTYNELGGTGAPPQQEGSGDIVLSSVEPTRAGYTFIGWSEQPNGYSPDFLAGETHTIHRSATLYAVWARDDKFTLFYGLNGGTGDFPPVECDPYTYATIAEGSPQRDGGYFRGWNPDPEAFYSIYLSGDKIQMTGNLILYAYYLDATAYSNNKYLKITYDANGGTGGPSRQYVTTGKSFTISPLFPTREGYRFDGWVSTSSSYSPGQEVAKAGNGDLMVTARWTQIPDCYLSFDANGGIGAPERVKNATAIPMEIPTRDGWTFVHWNTSRDDSGKVYERNAPITMLGNMTLYAIWQKDGAPVTYGDVDGVEGITEADASKILQYCVLPPAEQETFFTAEQLQAADVDGVAGITEADASKILQYCVMSPEEQATYKFPAQP